MGSKIFDGLIMFSRIFVGALFIVSGMVKANDPLGFSYKLEEYFSEAAFGWTFFEPYALIMGILVSCGEMILGFAIIFGGKPKLTIWLLLFLTVFFGFLTYYTATCDPNATYTVIEHGKEVKHPVQCVTDCGCFGDAMKGTIGRSLTPWESFTKDMVLLFFVLILFVGRNRITLNTYEQDKTVLRNAVIMLLLISGYFFAWLYPIVFSLVCFGIYLLLKKWHIKKIGAEWSIAIAMSLMSFGFAWYTYNYLPVKDFTPYAIGKSIPNGLKSAEDLGLLAPEYATEYFMTNSKTKDSVMVLSSEWLKDKKWQAPEWVIKRTGKQVLVREGYVSPIPPLSFYLPSDSGDVDVAYEIIENPSQPVLLLVSTKVEEMRTGKMDEINKLYDEAYKKGILFYCATSSGKDVSDKFAEKYKTKFKYVTGDEQGILKPMVRSNPGLVLLKKGTILGKWHYNTLPDINEINELLK